MAKKTGSSLLSAILIVFILIIIPLSIIGGFAYLIRKAYLHQQELMVKEISELPEFSETEEFFAGIASKLELDYPIKPPGKTLNEIRKEINNAVREMVKEKFPPSALSEQIREINKKYDYASPGQEVAFYLISADKKVSGIYHKKEDLFIFVGDEQYRINDIRYTDRYLFDPATAHYLASKEIKKIQEEFRSEEEKFRQESRAKISQECYKNANYVLSKRGEWVPATEIFKETVEREKALFYKEKAEKISNIIEKHRLLATIPVKAPEKALEKNKEAAETSKKILDELSEFKKTQAEKRESAEKNMLESYEVRLKEKSEVLRQYYDAKNRYFSCAEKDKDILKRKFEDIEEKYKTILENLTEFEDELPLEKVNEIKIKLGIIKEKKRIVVDPAELENLGKKRSELEGKLDSLKEKFSQKQKEFEAAMEWGHKLQGMTTMMTARKCAWCNAYVPPNAHACACGKRIVTTIEEPEAADVTIAMKQNQKDINKIRTERDILRNRMAGCREELARIIKRLDFLQKEMNVPSDDSAN